MLLLMYLFSSNPLSWKYTNSVQSNYPVLRIPKRLKIMLMNSPGQFSPDYCVTTFLCFFFPKAQNANTFATFATSHSPSSCPIRCSCHGLTHSPSWICRMWLVRQLEPPPVKMTGYLRSHRHLVILIHILDEESLCHPGLLHSSLQQVSWLWGKSPSDWKFFFAGDCIPQLITSSWATKSHNSSSVQNVFYHFEL